MLQFRFKQATSSIRLALRSGYSSSFTGAVITDTYNYGMTNRGMSNDKSSITIHVSIEELQCLLTGNLNVEET